MSGTKTIHHAISLAALSRLGRLPLALLLSSLLFSSAVRASDELRLDWKLGQEYAYNLTLDVESGGKKVQEKGTVRFRAEQVPPSSEASSASAYTGTGFVVHPNGYLLTCQHVIDNYAKIEVTLDEKKYEATLVAQDRAHDIALLHIDATGLPVVPLADSDKVELGEEMFAVGFPLSTVLGNSIKITRGILSGIQNQGSDKLLLVDAGINHGNSGGPLVNDRGQVAGVVAMVINPEVGNNVGFAQPINEAKKLLEANSVPFSSTDGKEKFETREVTKRVVPSVAFILMTAKPKSDDWRKLVYDVVLGSSHTTGSTIIDSLGVVQEAGGGDLTVGLLGNIGFEMLPGPGEKHWKVRRMLTVNQTVVAATPGAPAGGSLPQFGPESHGSPRSFGQHHRVGPRGMQRTLPNQQPQPQPQTAKTVVAIPAAEISSYEIVNTTPGLISIKKNTDMSTMPPGKGKPAWLTGQGEGVIDFDTQAGAVRSSNFTIKLTSSANETVSLTLAYQRLENGALASLPPIPSTANRANSGSSSSPRGSPDRKDSRPSAPGKSAVPLAKPAPLAKPLEVPGAADRSHAEKLVDDLFKNELAGLNSNDKRIELAQTLLKHVAGQRPGTADHYVLLDKARDLAMAGGDVGLTCSVIDTLTGFYQANGLELKAGALATLAEAVTSIDQQRVLVSMALSMLDQAIATDQIDVARQLGRVAYSAAKKTADKKLIAQTAERGKAFKAIQKDFEEFKAALATLKDDPKNAAASTLAGRYYCLAKDDWEKGLSLLAQCDDAGLAKLATQELANPSDGQARFELAEGWSDLAEQLQGTQQTRVQLHAHDLYQRALPSLTGLARIKAEKYLASSPTTVEPPSASSAPSADPKKIFDWLSRVVHANQQQPTKEIGTQRNKDEFKVIPPQGGLLIGFDVNADADKIVGLRPIFLTSGGQTTGRWCGVSKTSTKAKHVVAKKGYAVGGVKIKAGLWLDGMSLEFMEIAADGLRSGNSYESAWLGRPSAVREGVQLSGKGLPVVGIQGHSDATEITSFGLVLAEKK
jgi:Trypsin-like peptidase domain